MAVTSWGTGRPDYSQLSERIATPSIRTDQYSFTMEEAVSLAAGSSSTWALWGWWLLRPLPHPTEAKFIVKQIDFTAGSNTLIGLTLQSSQSTSTIIDTSRYQNITLSFPDGIDFSYTEDAIFTRHNLSPDVEIDYAFSVHGVMEVPMK